MLIAIVATLLDKNIISYEYILIGTLAGSVAGALFALKVKMTAMPQMVALFNGFGGAALYWWPVLCFPNPSFGEGRGECSFSSLQQLRDSLER